MTNDGFYNQDANMTYAVSGLYNSFLISELGGEKYMELYKKMNGDLEFVKNIKVGSFDLPEVDEWISFLKYYHDNPEIYFTDKEVEIDTSSSMEGGNYGYIDIWRENDFKFYTPEYMFLRIMEGEVYVKNYQSRLFHSMSPQDTMYSDINFEYGIFVDSISVKIINFYNDETVVNYIKDLSIEGVYVPQKYYKYQFFVRKTALVRSKIYGVATLGIILRSLYHK